MDVEIFCQIVKHELLYPAYHFIFIVIIICIEDALMSIYNFLYVAF